MRIRYLLGEAEETSQHLGDLDGEYKACRDADDRPYAATDRRPRLDDLRHSVKRRSIGEVQQDLGSFHDTQWTSRTERLSYGRRAAGSRCVHVMRNYSTRDQR